jgi:hypothetical protein
MLALWSVVWSFSFHQVSVCTVAGCWYCWYWCLVLCWRDQPHLLQLCLVHSWHATLEILNDVFYRQLPHILKYISSVGEIFGDGVWYYLLYSCSRVQCAPNLLLVPVSILSIHFIFRISCFALLFLFSFSLILCSCHRYTMHSWLYLLAFLSFVSWLVSNCLHFPVLDVDFLLPRLRVWTLFHWSWHATWTLQDAASWCFHCATLQHHLVTVYPFFICIFLVLCRYV